ncbi:Maf family protein [Thermoflexus sp.]|uniref:Maf family protein n=1 Tax=Thermoflexus sp. TaxID=1969742 RepID=UPI0025E4CB7E|nr:Maf family protein [Thermoflexus sp.]MDW8064268.1 Maf family protein [Anaerolineae bacterium]MCS6962566.1 Maf family protein [Thermoflexus sp.]MCS7351414.1 Maf family protein [Thermoflexus sp.]MCX7691303.1 Maf family protein [Thermoflexus sp.]MDW8180870.1 Maf family protein [Anaerolineae bacterium]
MTMIPKRWVLASASPRRQMLIQLLGYPVEVLSISIDETPKPNEDPAACAARLALAKAAAGARLAPDALVLAADTVVDLEGEILGKPEGTQEARAMLQALRGRPHQVHTAVALYHPFRGEYLLEVATTRVWMRSYTDEEIEAYLATGDPMDKAGAYAIQHPGFQPARIVEGCYAAVVGLPLCHLARALRRWGWSPSEDLPTRCQSALEHLCTAYPEILAPSP